MHLLIAIITVILLLDPAGPELDNSARKKFDNAVKSTFQTEEFTLEKYENAEQTFTIMNKDKLLGYAYISSAKGRYEEFDFTVLYSPGWVIEQVEVLVYRSDHGYEIMNKKWLAQFKGSTGCGLIYGKDIDAISGATLSGNALTDAVAEFCENVRH